MWQRTQIHLTHQLLLSINVFTINNPIFINIKQLLRNISRSKIIDLILIHYYFGCNIKIPVQPTLSVCTKNYFGQKQSISFLFIIYYFGCNIKIPVQPTFSLYLHQSFVFYFYSCILPIAIWSFKRASISPSCSLKSETNHYFRKYNDGQWPFIMNMEEYQKLIIVTTFRRTIHKW